MVEANGCNSANVAWTPTQLRVCDATIEGFSVRYQQSGTGGYSTVNTSSTSVSLQDLVPNAEYTVSVAAISSVGSMSTFAMTQFNLQGKYLLCLQGISGHSPHTPTTSK